jgi:Barstar (barnase inhibitor)
MAAIDRLLTGQTGPGVYHWPAAPQAAKVKATVEGAGWRFIGLDTVTVVDKAGLLDVVAKTFGFPAYFGRNFDAFADSLTEVRHETGVLVLWEGWAGLVELNPQTAGMALDVFAARVAETRWGAFAVVLAGPGPELDLPAFE